ncbi:MAG: hypothetical protein K8T10_08410 [Candidatus Eremiobacteraeota bacterium]|nr:hypothetical protein [Candidatus Eremiobacteraeota bacterium]
MDIDILKDKDNLRTVDFDKCECMIHLDHRWVLPIIYYAQEEGFLDKPCDLIMFDQHHDSKVPRCLERIKNIVKSGISFEKLIELCDVKSTMENTNEVLLSKNDEDWIIAGMELGLIDNLVAFGTREHPQRYSFGINNYHEDHLGKKHWLNYLSFPGSELSYEGCLSEYKDCYSTIWRILNWRYKDYHFSFGNSSRKILLDFDLDCFAMYWSDFRFPWPDEVFEKRFYEPSNYSTTQGWTGKMFLEGLMKYAGLITIAMEPDYCGGKKKSEEILKKVNHFLFDNNLSIASTSETSGNS